MKGKNKIKKIDMRKVIEETTRDYMILLTAFLLIGFFIGVITLMFKIHWAFCFLFFPLGYLIMLFVTYCTYLEKRGKKEKEDKTPSYY